jgi:hypothetical protein
MKLNPQSIDFCRKTHKVIKDPQTFKKTAFHSQFDKKNTYTFQQSIRRIDLYTEKASNFCINQHIA